MLYKYETHCHTAETSRCARTSGAEMARAYKEMGYTGLIISDHFLNGNTTVDKTLPWEQQVAEFERGYLAAKEEGDKIGLDVFFAWECSMSGDFLIYGLDKEWLLANPDQMSWKPSEYMTRAREAGGMVIHAHPFREASYINHIHLFPQYIDGVEIINASMSPEVNRRAEWYAREYGLQMSAGSDNHSGKREKLAGIYLPERITSMQDFCRLVKDGKAEIFTDRYDADGNRL